MMLTPGSGPWQLLATIYVDHAFEESKIQTIPVVSAIYVRYHVQLEH